MKPYLQLLYGAITLASIYAVFKSLVFNMHMFQLNGYRADTHFSWFKKNLSRYAVELIVFALSFTGLLADEELMAFPAAALLIAVIGMMPENRAKKYKKPLVYTPRVKRMTVTFCILEAAAFAGEILVLIFAANKNFVFLISGLRTSLAPLLVVVANLINKPMENGINLHYTRDAKRMLKENPGLSTIGITGSFGKTSVKFYLYTLMRSWTDTLVTPESYNTPMGIVKTVRGSLKPTHKVFLCEMGAKWVGDIKELCDIVHPQHGIITALGEQHLESFGSKENIIKTKYELAGALPEDGRLYVNFDNETIRNNPPKRKYITYGTTDDCDYYATDIEVSPRGTSFVFHCPDGESCEMDTRLLGRHSVINIVGAAAAAHGFGMPLEEIRLGVRRLEAVAHRMQIIPKGGVTIIDDAYNSNPAGCRAAIDTLNMMDGFKILVTPGMVELGGRENDLNREFGAYAAGRVDKLVLVGAKQTAAIYAGAKEAGMNERDIKVFDVFTEAMKYVYSLHPDKKEIVLLENDLPDNY